MSTPSVLQSIVQTKRDEVHQRSRRVSIDQLNDTIATLPRPRNFHAALAERVRRRQPAVIAEFKRASPSAGWINQHADPVATAQTYEQAGAACLSVLTDAQYFRGSDEDLIHARTACSLPVIRKDFMIDPYQVIESRALGADAVLLIAAALDDDQLHALSALAHSLALSVLVEVHDAAELARALAVPGNLLGINNRDLHRFITRLDTSIELAPKVPDDRIVIAESGIHGTDDVLRLRQANIHAFLIGEALMRASDAGTALEQLLS
ncbi:MAG: indole-3-glycerol phosphate synthase TrpC [Pseudomonadota bacterium]